jgi:glycosyltransferase involved in cell wall biosynthesis
MKILHIINTLGIGGAQSVLVQLLEGWGGGEDQHMVISLMERAQLAERVEALDVRVEHIDMHPNKMELSKFLRLIRTIRFYKPDIIQTWLYHADLIGSIAARLISHSPIVWGIHHSTINASSVKVSTWRYVKLLSRLSNYIPSRIVCCSDSVYQTHVKLGYKKEKLIVIVNGIDTIRFQPNKSSRTRLRNELGLSESTILIGNFGRFHPQKDHDTLFRAAGIFLGKYSGVHFVLAGEGIDNSNQHIRAQNVHLLGNRLDMPYLSAGLDILTLTSSYGEALPLVLGEAMACGIPCVATDVGDSKKLIANTGIVVQPNNPQVLADAWQSILELPEAEYILLSQRARQRIVDFYGSVTMINEYKNIYHNIFIFKGP